MTIDPCYAGSIAGDLATVRLMAGHSVCIKNKEASIILYIIRIIK